EWPYWQLARAGWSSAGTDAPEAIVVLSASVRRPVPPEPRFVPSYSKYVRLQHAAWLYHNWRRLPVLVSGGPDGQAVMADVMKTALEGAGVPASDIWVERRSQSTYQNAVYSAELLKQKGIRRVVLVTEAYHMRRAEASFRKAGLEVSPAPCNFRSVGFQWELGDLLFQARAADYNDEALHEWIGLVSYWLQGRANLFSF
ncbi:MAG TPA: YdcF family protein, partial [Bryobacteraceae bacterium]|nr:YdcF family protein [Bryobacteraceae bacterium]